MFPLCAFAYIIIRCNDQVTTDNLMPRVRIVAKRETGLTKAEKAAMQKEEDDAAAALKRAREDNPEVQRFVFLELYNLAFGPHDLVMALEEGAHDMVSSVSRLYTD